MKTNNTQPISNGEFERLIAERLSLLPPDVKRAISDSHLGEHLLEVAQRNRLRVDESKTLENETMLALLGVEPLENFRSNLGRHANLSPEAAATVSNDVNRLIFAPIRESLKKLWDEEGAEEPEAPAEPSFARAETEEPYKKPDTPAFTPAKQSVGGVERTMPRDIVEAKLKGTVRAPTERYRTADENQPHPYSTGDPYREPIE